MFSRFLFFPFPGLNCLLTINKGAKSYQCWNHFQRRGSRLQTKQQPYRCSRRVCRGSQGQVSSLCINTGSDTFQGTDTGNTAPNKDKTATLVLERGSPIILLVNQHVALGAKKCEEGARGDPHCDRGPQVLVSEKAAAAGAVLRLPRLPLGQSGGCRLW